MRRRPLLAICSLLLLASCGGESEHFRAAQELIAVIEAGSEGTGPRYEDYRYEDVLVELAQVTPDDKDYAKARDWIAKIREGRDKAIAAAKQGGPKAPGPKEAPAVGVSGGRPVAAAAGPTDAPDLLEPHEHRGPADVFLMGFRVIRDTGVLRITGDVINGTEQALLARVTVTVLAKDGAELATETGPVVMPFAPNDRSEFAVTMAAYDPNAPPPPPEDVPMPDVPPDFGGGTAFDPNLAAKFRLDFHTESGPLTWRDDRFGRRE